MSNQRPDQNTYGELSMEISTPKISSVHLLHVTRQNLTFFSSRTSFCSPLTKWKTKPRGQHCQSQVRPAVVQPDPSEPTGPVSITAIVGEGSISPLKETPWEEVMTHTAERLKWVDEDYQMRVITDKSAEFRNSGNEISNSDLLVNVALKNEDSVEFILKNSSKIPNIISFDSSPNLLNKLNGKTIENSSNNSSLKTVSDAWERQNSDDIRFCILVLINASIRPVSSLQNLRAKGLSTLTCMVKNCAPQIINCLLDPNCRKAIQCLNNCSPTDQVCNYRCIASYESKNLEAFSLCVLQKHNCLNLNAEISYKPYIQPLEKFRGTELSHNLAEDLFIGWLGKLGFSWRVVCGQNPAYDQFPCQYQLFYRGKKGNSVWYEPVFQVKTLDGDLVWRRRKYRVKRSTIPGTFYFTVLDNGVTSTEFWTIVDASDSLSFALFHYTGAATKAGLSYSGSVLVTPDGKYPAMLEDRKRLELSLGKCGIKTWELYEVDNCSCDGAPLGVPEGSRLHECSVFREEILGV